MENNGGSIQQQPQNQSQRKKRSQPRRSAPIDGYSPFFPNTFREQHPRHSVSGPAANNSQHVNVPSANHQQPRTNLASGGDQPVASQQQPSSNRSQHNQHNNSSRPNRKATHTPVATAIHQLSSPIQQQGHNTRSNTKKKSMNSSANAEQPKPEQLATSPQRICLEEQKNQNARSNYYAGALFATAPLASVCRSLSLPSLSLSLSLFLRDQPS